jgi:hypothetical protein
MKNDNDGNRTSSKGPGTKADVKTEEGGINPSAPTAGTEGWGTTSDERRVLSNNDPAATRAGQMKGNPGDHQTASVEQAGGGAASSQFRKQNPDDNRTETSHRKS